MKVLSSLLREKKAQNIRTMLNKKCQRLYIHVINKPSAKCGFFLAENSIYLGSYLTEYTVSNEFLFAY